MTEMSIQNLMQQSGVAFGTSGVRGLVTQMTDKICMAYTAAFLQTLSATYQFDRVALGIDLRPSSPAIAAACAASIQAQGLSVVYCGALPTPALALYAQQQNIPAIMVTGSHIPFDRNGIKFYRPDGEISKADELAITQSHVTLSGATPTNLPEVNTQALSDYVQRYVTFFPAGILKGLKLGLYEHSSVARDVLRSILETLGAQVVSIVRTDVFVPIDTEAVSEQDRLRGQAWVREYGLDAIISTDGDGDRPLISDEHGNWLRGDIVGLLTSQYLGISQVALPVSCNTAIELSSAFTKVTRTRIGSPFVIEAMQNYSPEAGFIGGFEANGGYLLGSDVTQSGRSLVALPTRDAVLPALAVLAAAQTRAQPVSTLLQDLPQRFTASDRLQNFPVARSQELFAQWSQDISVLAELFAPECGDLVNSDATDGLRMTFARNEIIHLRASGNAPELRCYCEAASSERAMELTQLVLGRIHENK